MAEIANSKLEGIQAVVTALADHPAVKTLLSWNAEAVTDALFDRGELSLTVAASEVVQATEALRAAGYNYFEDMTAVDWLPRTPRFQLSYHFVSIPLKERIRLHAWVGASGEEQPSIPSITPAWPSANYFEREVFDLFGIRFESHPNLRRIMMPDEWKGYPLRKDYPVEGYR